MSIGQRLQRLEGALTARRSQRIDPKDKVIAIPYPNGNRDEFERRKQERMAELRKKYGLGISEDDILVIGIRKFYRQRVTEEAKD